MKFYYAAAESSLKELHDVGVKNLLISMANGKNKIPKVKEIYNDYDLIIDSGAFTYHKKGGITVDEWLEQLNNIYDDSAHVISLDVIGDAKSSYDNYMIIKTEIDCIPTFHVGSDLIYLNKYLEHTNRIAIGGMVNYKSSISTLCRYLNEIFVRFSPDTLPKFHAFGYFSQQILQQYPFYSCDASTWQNYARFGEFHAFERFKYKRIKSLKVDMINIRNQPIKYLTALRIDDPINKLKLIVKALTRYEEYITNIWTNRNVSWSNLS